MGHDLGVEIIGQHGSGVMVVFYFYFIEHMNNKYNSRYPGQVCLAAQPSREQMTPKTTP